MAPGDCTESAVTTEGWRGAHSGGSPAIGGVRGPMACFLCGIRDALDVVTPLRCMCNSKQIRDDTLNCVVMNGVIFLGVMKFFQLVIDPFFSNCPADEELWSCFLGGTGNANSNDSEAATPLVPLHRWFFNILFVVPLFVLSKIVSNFFFQDIADAGYAHLQANPETEAQKMNLIRAKKVRAAKQRAGFRANVLATMADMIFSILMQLVLLVEIVLISLGPGPCPYVAFIYSAWQWSLYCFEYTWINRGWTLSERIEYFESAWVYFLGFGSPYAVIILQVDFFTGAALTQLFFPLFVLIAVNAEPVRSSVITRIPICRESRWVTNKIMKHLPSAR